VSIKHAILGLLAGGPLHGYDLKAAYESDLVPEAQLNYGQVYTTLERLHRDGLVSPEVVTQTERPDRKVYSLTEEGRRELAEWLNTPSRQDLDLRNETFLKLMLAQRLQRGGGAAGAVTADPFEVLAAERRSCMGELHKVTSARARAEQEGAPLATVLLLDLAVLRLDAFHRWLEHCEELLRQADDKREGRA
jgi:DNA-binding PadR family transcriptional regulator